jgi:hypothetical protein
MARSLGLLDGAMFGWDMTTNTGAAVLDGTSVGESVMETTWDSLKGNYFDPGLIETAGYNAESCFFFGGTLEELAEQSMHK